LRLRTVVLVVTVLIVVLGAGLYVAVTHMGKHLPLARGCEVRASGGSVALDITQMANAATVAAVGIRRALPERAIVVALATAFQESKLENLDGGDRDSVGLFQQRPSQGWGTAEQLRDPRYASGKFYTALLRVPGWQNMRITEAAQRVQRSAYPEAYERWSDKAFMLVEALAGRVSGAVSCTRVGAPAVRGAAATAALGAGLHLDWGDLATVASSDVVGLVVAAANEQAGWQFAHWLVAHSAERGVARVRFGSQEWTADRGSWLRVDPGDGDHSGVVADVYGF
jgi:hypothetical protein